MDFDMRSKLTAALLILAINMEAHSAQSKDVLLSCVTESNLPSPVINGMFPLSPDRLLIASDYELTFLEGSAATTRSIEWPDEIVAAIPTVNGALIVSKSAITHIDAEGIEKEKTKIHDQFMAEENAPDLLLYGEQIYEFISPDIVSIYLGNRSIIFRISDRKILDLGPVRIGSFLSLVKFKYESNDIRIYNGLGKSVLFDAERFKKYEIKSDLVSSAHIVDKHIVAHFTEEKIQKVRIIGRDTGDYFDLDALRTVIDPIHGILGDGKIFFGSKGMPNISVTVVDPIARTISASDGSFGQLMVSNDRRYWVFVNSNGVMTESSTPGILEQLNLPASLQLDFARFVGNDKILAATSAGLLLIDLAQKNSRLLHDQAIKTPIYGGAFGRWVAASDTSVIVYQYPSTIFEVENKIGTIRNITQASRNFLLASGHNGFARIDIDRKSADFFQEENNDEFNQENEIPFVDENSFIIKEGEYDYLVLIEYGMQNKYRLRKGINSKRLSKLSNGNYAVHGVRELLIFNPQTESSEYVKARSGDEGRVYSVTEDSYLFYNGSDSIGDVVFETALEGGQLVNKSSIERLPPQDLPVELKWKLNHPCSSGLRQLDPVMRVQGEHQDKAVDTDLSIGRTASDGDNWATGTANATFNSAGSWKVDVVATINDEEVIIASDELSIATSWSDIASQWWKFGLSVAAGFYVVSFAFLFFLAHYRSWALRVVTDPVWAKIAIWPFFALRHSAFAQKWALAPYFADLRQTRLVETTSYLPMNALNMANENKEASQLLNHFVDGHLLWLQGAPGMGKSLVFRTWLRRYFVDHPNLSSAYTSYGFILIPILIRDYASLPERAEQRSDWFVEVMRRQLSAGGIRIDDVGLVKAMLLSGRFALALDGLNEADRDLALAEFVAAYPRVKIIATCQSLPLPNFELWALPKTIEASRQGLLRLWLGQQKGDEVEAQLQSQGTTAYLVSGYDVRLIADLAIRTPDSLEWIRSRIDLYVAVLDLATNEVGERMDLTALKDVAWKMLVDGRRHLSESEQDVLGANAIERLSADGTRILRQLGERYEFRHDQMRSFLAALKMVNGCPNVQALINQLNDSPVWLCGRKDQEELWLFVADLLVASDVNTLWQAMLADPSRAWAQTALHARAARENIALIVDGKPPS